MLWVRVLDQEGRALRGLGRRPGPLSRGSPLGVSAPPIRVSTAEPKTVLVGRTLPGVYPKVERPRSGTPTTPGWHSPSLADLPASNSGSVSPGSDPGGPASWGRSRHH